MTRTKRHKGLIALTLTVIVLGLLSLGMKLPNLVELATQTSKPKPRPRALVKNQISSCNQIIKKVATDDQPCVAVAPLALTPIVLVHVSPAVAAMPAQHQAHTTPSRSRAPPCTLA